jgi:tRNA threonylcarbamoyl adenosine modification protein YeaZ
MDCETMRILGLDSSSQVASVAVVEFSAGSENLLFEENTPHARSDSSALFQSLQKAVSLCGTPDALCVGLGPGSYNGLRASIATARAMATALDRPLHALPSPLSLPGSEEGCWVIGDARGGHLWVACVQQGAFLEEPSLIAPRDILDHLAKRPDLTVLGPASLAEIPSLRISTPSAAQLARLAHRCDPVYLSDLTPEPLYLKPPHITAPKVPAAATR